jgi:hypothetical protein
MAKSIDKDGQGVPEKMIRSNYPNHARVGER